MNRIVVLFLALWLAVHVAVGPFPAPVPILGGFTAALATLGYACWVASGCRLEWRTAPC